MDSQRNLVKASLDRDNQHDVTPIRLKHHPAYIPPADQKERRIAELKAELLSLEGGEAA